MSRRPSSILVVGIVLLLDGMYSLLSLLVDIPGTDVMPVWMSQDQIKYHNIAVLIAIAFAVGTLVSAIYILSGENWARWFYAGLCLGMLVYTVFFMGGALVALVPFLVVRAICVLFLFLPNANDYFTRRPRRWH